MNKSPRSLRLRQRPIFWTLSAVFIGCTLPVAWLFGALSGGLDVQETCALRGQTYDHAYRAEHWSEPSQFFPLHNKCNAAYDLVPFWVNPTLVCLAVLAAGSLVMAITTAVRRAKRLAAESRPAPS
jgi:hypothetical protein